MRSFMRTTVAALGIAVFAAGPASADALLNEAVGFRSTIFYLESGVPGMVIAVVKGDETFVTGIGETKKGNGITPTGDSTLRIGSITKSFTGQVLAYEVAKGTVNLTTPAAELISGELGNALESWPAVSLIDLVTHSGGFPREVPREDSQNPTDPFSTITLDAFAGWIKDNPPLFQPGNTILYSNFGFDILSEALSEAAGKPYVDILQETILDPLGMTDTGFERSDSKPDLAMYGHGFDREALPHIRTGNVITGSGGLTSTANDMIKWMRWHLDEGPENKEAWLLDHAVYFSRDHFDQVFGMDESGRMEGIGLAWVAMNETRDRPFILQKAGGLQGELSYVALAPSHDVGVFISINEFNFGAAINMAAFANNLVGTLSGY